MSRQGTAAITSTDGWFVPHVRPDMEFINSMIDETAIDRLKQVAETPFVRCSYTEAIEILQDAIREKKKKFQYKVSSPNPLSLTKLLGSCHSAIGVNS